MTSRNEAPLEAEYVVVGSGAGGGTVAARLAEAGRSVVLLEAGGDPRALSGGDPVSPHTNRLPADYDVPAFHGFASENEALKWDFFVRHFEDDGEQKRDPKFVAEKDGVLYPRAGTLGGCTSHNALIMVYPKNSDWDYIAELTGDRSWESGRMREHFVRLEDCRYRPMYRGLAMLGWNPTRHGFKGWLPTERSIPLEAIKNRQLKATILDSVGSVLREEGHDIGDIATALARGLDPNDWDAVENEEVGLRHIPLTTWKFTRRGTRERVLQVSKDRPDRLKVVLNALAARVRLEGGRAVGVEYLQGERLYRAHGTPSGEAGTPAFVRATREVILAGGAFNTPQLLMLSGIGPPETLQRFGIPVAVPLAGVGRNLQDRYEIGIVNRMSFDKWAAYEGAQFGPGDPQFDEWKQGKGVYATNGSILTLFRRSPGATSNDVFCMSLLTSFSGYFPGYSKLIPERLNYLTWVVLKAHTKNRAGEVTLRSADPRDMPLINFRYFDQGGDEDLDAVVDGVRFARHVSQRLRDRKLIAGEELPGDHVASEADLRDFVRYNCWGHHASCSCPIGAEKEGGVLTSDFRVHNTEGLRVVDASVFPRIPGFFIVSAVYMIGEKAADVILKT